MASLHITVGRPSDTTANGILQTVYTLLSNENFDPKRFAMYMSNSDRKGPRNSSCYGMSLCGVVKLSYDVLKSLSDIHRIYYYGGCHWRYWLIAIAVRCFGRKDAIQILVPSGAYSAQSYGRRSRVKRLIMEVIEFRVNRVFDFIQALSIKEKEDIEILLPGNKRSSIVIIPNAISCGIEKIYAQGPMKRVAKLLFLGRKDFRYKGIKETCEAVSILNARGVPVELNIYGSEGNSEDKSLLRAAIQSNQGVVKSLPAVFGDSKNSVLAEHDMFILASRSEGLPTTLIEAAQAGLLCFATAETNLDDEDFCAGVVRVKRTPQDIADNIESYLRLARTNITSYQQTTHFRKKYGIEAVWRLHLRTYE
jgi:glycosyltransferase involved in cell wall biosynthesis